MFELDLDTVLTVYREALGSGTLLLCDLIRRVEPTKDGTLATSANGTLYYCPEWCEKWVTNPLRLRDVLLHEVGHPVMGDFNRENSWLSNFAADAVINAFLFNSGLSPCELMKAFYSKTEQDCILRSMSSPDKDFKNLYNRLYSGHMPNERINLPSTPEVMQALQVLIPPEEREDICFLGHHGAGCSTPTEDMNGNPIVIDRSLPGDVVNDIGEAILNKIDEIHLGAGTAGNFSDMMVGVKYSPKRIKEDVLRQYATSSRLDKLRTYFEDTSYAPSVVPINVSRSQAVQMAMGFDPVMYRAPFVVENEGANSGLYVYIDVSGSVMGALHAILGVIAKLKDIVKHIYEFSTIVNETTPERMGTGKFRSTGGTDFDCIINHAVDLKAKKVLIFTDGCAGVSPACEKAAIANIEKMGLVYFGGAWRNNWIDRHYKSVHMLKDVIS